jgi:hypothetical protein
LETEVGSSRVEARPGLSELSETGRDGMATAHRREVRDTLRRAKREVRKSSLSRLRAKAILLH